MGEPRSVVVAIDEPILVDDLDHGLAVIVGEARPHELGELQPVVLLVAGKRADDGHLDCVYDDDAWLEPRALRVLHQVAEASEHQVPAVLGAAQRWFAPALRQVEARVLKAEPRPMVRRLELMPNPWCRRPQPRTMCS